MSENFVCVVGVLVYLILTKFHLVILLFLLLSLDPEWLPEHQSTFMLQCPAYKLVDGDGLVFTIMDYDALSKDEQLGTVRVPPSQFVTSGSSSQVLTRKIRPPPESDKEDAGYLTIRVRKATTEDEVSLINGENKRLFETHHHDHVHDNDSTRKDSFSDYDAALMM